MTLQELVAFWHAQPFQPFQIHTVRGVFEVPNPLSMAMSQQLSIAVVVDGSRAETFSPEEIVRCEIVGEPVDFTELMSAIPAETLARNSRILAAATAAPSDPEDHEIAPPSKDSGIVQFLSAYDPKGVFLVHASVSTIEGEPMFNTMGTRWNLHGIETFENGASLYLHHLDHPTVEQRIILWPPDRGTFESFAESTKRDPLIEELKRRDLELTARATTELEPSKSYFHGILPREIQSAPARFLDARGEERPYDPDRHQLELVPQDVRANERIHGPRIVDVLKEEAIFDLSCTRWDATVTKNGQRWKMSLRHYPDTQHPLTLVFDVWERTVHVEGDSTPLSFEFTERHLINFGLYEPWEPMVAALRAGPHAVDQPDLVLPIPGGFRAELWPGETRYPLPFLQPRFVNPNGRTLLDLRGTTWSALLRIWDRRPVVTLRFMSEEKDDSLTAARYPVVLDLVTHRATCGGVEGSTTLGMLQTMVRTVRGVKWMQEELPTWFEKGRSLPSPVDAPTVEAQESTRSTLHNE